MENKETKYYNSECFQFYEAYKAAKRRADKRGLEFELDVEFLMTLFKEQKGKCYYSGMNMHVFNMNMNRLLQVDPYKMSLDRKDPNIGYTRGNVVWCLFCINSFKLQMNKNSLTKICKAIVSNAN